MFVLKIYYFDCSTCQVRTRTRRAALLMDVYAPAFIVTDSSRLSRHGWLYPGSFLYGVLDDDVGHVDFATCEITGD